MIHPIVLLGAFYGHYFTKRFNYTDKVLFSAWIGTNRADLCIRNIMAFGAEADLFTHATDRFSKMRDHFFLLFEKVQNQSERGFSPDAR